MSQFQITDISGNKQWMEGQNLVVMLLLVIATMIVIWGIPKITNIIPAPLAGIIVVAMIVIF